MSFAIFAQIHIDRDQAPPLQKRQQRNPRRRKRKRQIMKDAVLLARVQKLSGHQLAQPLRRPIQHEPHIRRRQHHTLGFARSPRRINDRHRTVLPHLAAAPTAPHRRPQRSRQTKTAAELPAKPAQSHPATPHPRNTPVTACSPSSLPPNLPALAASTAAPRSALPPSAPDPSRPSECCSPPATRTAHPSSAPSKR